ncbi:hypothetical protein RclHR1_01150026 [Rhizophagus clarus]|nr:hypothetical protein RclHR1_01150026 [Rhizophagus clarus]
MSGQHQRINATETVVPGLIKNNNIYKLDMRDPSKYKWPLLFSFDNSDNSNSSFNVFKPTNSTPIQASVDSASRSKIKNKNTSSSEDWKKA